MEYNCIDLDQYCLTQEEIDDENACEKIKKIKNVLISSNGYLCNQLENYIISDHTSVHLTTMITGWIIKIPNVDEYIQITKTDKTITVLYRSGCFKYFNNLPKDVYYDKSDGSYTYANDNSYILK